MKKFIGWLKTIMADKRNLPNMLLIKLSRFFSDKKFIEIKYRIFFGKEINLNSPQTFNEKLNWLKINNRNPLYTLLADKYWVKNM